MRKWPARLGQCGPHIDRAQAWQPAGKVDIEETTPAARADGGPGQKDPVEEPIEVTGPITVHLWAASSARDTDFVVKLMDVWPDGFVQELCYGIVRARYRQSFTSPSLIEPGRTYEYTVRVSPTGNLFRRGHRIRLDVSSSDFPNFGRNHNTGGDDYAETTLVTARQTICHDRQRPSRVVLPVIRCRRPRRAPVDVHEEMPQFHGAPKRRMDCD